jgi:hypothetical protein
MLLNKPNKRCHHLPGKSVAHLERKKQHRKHRQWHSIFVEIVVVRRQFEESGKLWHGGH